MRALNVHLNPQTFPGSTVRPTLKEYLVESYCARPTRRRLASTYLERAQATAASKESAGDAFRARDPRVPSQPGSSRSTESRRVARTTPPRAISRKRIA